MYYNKLYCFEQPDTQRLPRHMPAVSFYLLSSCPVPLVRRKDFEGGRFEDKLCPMERVPYRLDSINEGMKIDGGYRWMAGR